MKVKGESKTFDYFNIILLGVITFIVIYPFLYTLSVSISHPEAVAKGEVTLLPVGLNFSAYKKVLLSPRIWQGYWNSTVYTSIGTLVRLLLLLFTSYPLSQPKFLGRNFFTFLITFTMLFSGGLVPYFLVVRALGLLNTLWAMVIPGALSAWNIIVVRTFFQSTIHPSLIESAQIDGANDFQILFRIVFPLSTPIIAVMSLFIAVGIWNDYFTPLIFITDDTKFPLTIILRDIVVMAQGREFLGLRELGAIPIPAQSVQAATLIISMIPVLIAYPFIQKYFIKGIMIGAIKG
jgi:putative aldouronate transport system permease protein